VRVERGGVRVEAGVVRGVPWGRGADEALGAKDVALVRPRESRGQVERLDPGATRDRAVGQVSHQGVDVLDRATGGIRERRVVAVLLRVAGTKVRDDVRDVGVGEEAAHRVGVERVEVRRVQLLVVRAKELVGDPRAEPPIQHLAERVHGRITVRPEEQRDEALQELLGGELMDVQLEREVDVSARIADLRAPLDGADVLPGHALSQPLLDRRVLEVEEVARVVPDEAVLDDRLAVAPRLVVRLADEDACVGMRLAPPVREAQAADARADHEPVDLGQRRRDHQPSLDSSFWKMRRAIAIAQPYVLSIPKYDIDFDSRLCRREYGVSDA